MSDSPSQRWSSAVFDLFACARGRLPAAFLERRLNDLGLAGVKPLARDEIQRFEQAVELVSSLIAGRPAPGGQKPDAALAAAFPEDHPTLGGLRPLAQAYVESMRPAKADKRRAAEPEAPARSERPRPDRGPRHGDRDQRGDRDRGHGRPEHTRPAPAARPPRVTWEQWLARHLAPPAPAVPAEVAPAETAPADAATGAAAATATAPAPAPVAAPAPVWVPPSLANWLVDAEAKRHLARIRDRVTAVIAAKAEPAAALRELAFALLRPPLTVRDDLRNLIGEHLQQHGIAVPLSALFPPPALAALKRDWENLLVARGPSDPAVEAAWRKLVEAHPDARAKLEAERAHELEDLVRRFAAALREFGDADQRTIDLGTRLTTRHASGAERIAAEVARVKAVDEALDQAGALVASHGWESPEVVAAMAALEALDPKARRHLEGRRRHELDELDRRLRAASREHGPAGEATLAALARLRERFPTEGAAAAARLERFRRGDDIAQQERERRETGRSLSTVHLAGTEHRLPHLRPAPRWRLVVALAGMRAGQQPVKEDKPKEDRPRDGRGKDAKAKEPEAKPKAERRRDGVAVAWLIAGPVERGPVAADWRPADSGSLDELDACVQAVVDREGGVLGIPLADCPEHGGGAWSDAAWALSALAALVLPTAGTCAIDVELPAWADAVDPRLDGALVALAAGASAPHRALAIARAPAAGDHAAALAEAVAWSWAGKKDADGARIRQSGLLGGCLLQPAPLLRDAIAQLGAGALPAWPVWSALLADAAGDPEGIAAALLAQLRPRIAASTEAVQSLHRHLTGLARGRIAHPDRLARELAWFDGMAAGLRPRDRLRLDGALLAAQATAGRIDPASLERLNARLAELREDWPAEVLETALHAAAHAREALDGDAAEAVLAPWARTDALACGGRALLVRLCEERARIAAGAGRWKEARKQLDRGAEAAARSADPADREHALSRLATLRAAVLCDDPAVEADEARAALAAVIGGVEPSAAAATLAVEGTPRHAHHAVLRWAVRRQDETVSEGYYGKRASWSDARESPAILALRAVLLARPDPEAAKALLAEAAERGGEGATAAQRLSLLACAVAAALHGAVLPDLRERLAELRRDHPAAAPAVTALERALGLAPDVRAGLAEALPLLAR